LSDDEKKMFIRQADVFAGYFAYTDHEIGRVIDEIDRMGKLDNTLIIYIAGDNGNSAEGSLVGTPNRKLDHPLDATFVEEFKCSEVYSARERYPDL
jgi:arylsulfatase A-like enzyme